MSDASLMLNMLSGSSTPALLFRDSQIRDLPDNPNAGYGNGQTTFETRNITEDMFAMSQSDFIIPWSIGINGALGPDNCLGTVTKANLPAGPGQFVNGSCPGYVAETGGSFNLASKCSLAFKSSSLDLVTGLNVGLANSNSSIVSEINYLSVLNQIKLLVQTSQDWLEIFGPKLCFSKDTSSTVVVGDTTSGFAQRQAYLYKNATVSYYAASNAAQNSTTAYIARIQCASIVPARLLHNFLANLDSPERGIQWRLNLLFCKEFNQQSLTSGFVFAGAAPNVSPTYSICGPQGSSIFAGGQTYSGCMMKYRSITLPAEMQVRYDSQILDNKMDKKYIEYVVTDVYDNQVNSTGSLKSYQLANGIVKPIRVWTFGLANGSLASNTALRVTNVAFSSLNCKIGTTNRFVQPLASGYDMYDELQQQMQELAASPDKGSLLSYNDFYPSGDFSIPGQSEAGLYHFTCMDLARPQGRVEDAAISLILDGGRTTQVPTDYICIVERTQVCRMDRTRNTVTVAVGSMVD
jgi:hypothetical protein